MILLSLFMGLPLFNNKWWFLYEVDYSYLDITFSGRSPNLFYTSLSLMIPLTHLIILMLPFLVTKKYFSKILIVAPLIYIVSMGIYDLFTTLFLLPFIIVWLIAIFKQNKLKRGKQAISGNTNVS